MKILFVGFSNSIHTQRWIKQISDLGWDLRLFPSVPDLPLHSDLRDICCYHLFYGREVDKNKLVRPLGIPVYSELLAKLLNNLLLKIFPEYRKYYLALIILLFNPDVVHSLELQHAGYLTRNSRKILRRKFPYWAVSLWGSDIYYFGRDPKHSSKIRQTMQRANLILSESDRDRKLAIKFGANTKNCMKLPSAGGFDLTQIRSNKQVAPSKRNLIMVKGYEDWSGKGLISIKALGKCLNLLVSCKFEIVLHSAIIDGEVENVMRAFCAKYNIPLNILRPGLTHRRMLEWYGRSRCSISISITDGVPNSLLESMVMGAFPIQTNASAADEWIKDKKTGFLVSLKNVNDISDKIRVALTNDQLVNKAAVENYKVIKDRLNSIKIKKQVIDLYTNIS